MSMRRLVYLLLISNFFCDKIRQGTTADEVVSEVVVCFLCAFMFEV